MRRYIMNTVQNKSKSPSSKWRATLKRTGTVWLRIILSTVILLLTLGSQKILGQGVGISETSIAPDASSILELRWTAGTYKGFLAPRMTYANMWLISSPAQGLLVYATDRDAFYYYNNVTHGWVAIAATSLGTSNQLLGMNVAGTANEYKTLSGTANQINVLFVPGNITLSTPQDIHSGAKPVFVGLTLSGLTPNSGVYTNGTNVLTSTPPSIGILGYWNRAGNILSPSNGGDAITTSGNIYTTVAGTITSAGLLTGSSGANISGGAINLNDNSNNLTNINTGGSTGAVTIGGTGTQPISIGNGAGIKTLNLGSNNTTSNTTILSGTGGTLSINANAGGAVTNIGTGVTSTGNINIGGTNNKIFLPKFLIAGVLHNMAGGEVTSGPISLITDISGTLPVGNGGTGLTTFGGTNTVLYTSTADNLNSVLASTGAG
ncbi:MAG: hypothetical protein ABR974_14030, partial [Bacteroidales bacterium]